MRTTILLPDELYRATKRRATEEGRTMTSFIEEALRAQLAALPESHTPFRIDVFDGGGPAVGVDLSSNAELLERMES
ncbi:ribbon-helix-helix domain-containing protein [Rathayibacter sp. CAU 1779]